MSSTYDTQPNTGEDDPDNYVNIFLAPQIAVPQAAVQRGENDGGLEIYLFYCKEEEQHTHIGFKDDMIAVYSLEDMKLEIYSADVELAADYLQSINSDPSVGLEATYAATRIF